MSAFGGKADIERCCEESPLLTQSGHRQRDVESGKTQCMVARGVLPDTDGKEREVDDAWAAPRMWK